MAKKALPGQLIKKQAMKFKSLGLLLVLAIFCFACQSDSTTNKQKQSVEKPKALVPSFQKDSAFVFVEKQLAFGTRVPGSEGHAACKDWLIETMRSYGADVIKQDFIANIYTGENLPASNIIAQFNPKHKERIILSAHWDSRFMAEEDQNNDRKDDPIPGADDAGSGVAVLLEIARQLSNNPIDYGIDIILWDAEDQGERGGQKSSELTWCLGSQYWSLNKHRNNYRANYGINLDMVGGKNPRFGKDAVSMYYAPKVMDKVWKLAKSMGYSDMFVDTNTGGITDDHKMVNEIAGIPMINIINQPSGSRTGFVPHWHTHDDDIENIDRRTLKAVGQVVLATIYKESDGTIKSFE